jgi:cellulose synthase/poly-beta-1,6-N-acetylglucosamine synthase-like glycosyltransferase
MILILVSAVGLIAALATLPGTIELAMLTVGGAFSARPTKRRARKDNFRLAVVVPAHNEEHQITRCVQSLLAADRTGVDLSIAVIADNCTDQTAATARHAGARVLERTNADLRGKGYALDYAFTLLQPEGYQAFMVVDADSVIGANALTETVETILAGADAVQCRYLVSNPGDSARTKLMNVALMAFNVLRPRGRDRLGLSVGIYGNGFALSSETLKRVPYEASSVVEDLEYHLNLVRAGRKVRFADRAAVYGDMPVSGKGVSTQRTRWEGGRFRMLAERAPGLVSELLHGRLRLFEPLLDLLLLPLAFHVSLLMVAALTPFWMARDLGLAGLAVVVVHLLVTVTVCGNGWRDVAVLATAPFYIVWKLIMLPSVLRSAKANATWVRTERTSEERTR